jgi:hypothetical protein
MSYTRGETYIWSDGERLHIWSESGMDDWHEAEKYEGNPNASGVQITESIADDFAVMRFAEILKAGNAQKSIESALANWSGNSGCEALEQFAEQLRQLLENK